MKITRSWYFYFSIIILSVLIIAFTVYFHLGGLKEIQVRAYPEVNYSLAGTEFKGNYDDPEIQVLYKKAKELVLSGDINGILSVIDYPDLDLGEKEVRLFIGIILKEKITEIPTNYKVRKIESRGALGVELDMHPFVRPTKDDIESEIYLTAQKNGLDIDAYFLEKHFKDDRIKVEAFLK